MATEHRMWQLFLDLEVCRVNLSCLRHYSTVGCPWEDP